MPKVTVRAGDRTPPELRHLDGRTYRLPVDHPGPGFTGELFGIPGFLREGGEHGLTWEIAAPWPTAAEVNSTQLADLLNVLTEIRDLLKAREPSELVKKADELGKALEVERALQVPADMINLPSFGTTLAQYRKEQVEPWSAPAADDSGSSSATGTAPTGR